ncbi:MAG: two-component system, chemotaxis family, chemotaxis protein CheY [Verrucomicrobiota bacterium]|jgi:two-component system chemotaxis response regulator CheY|nr:two-component system, chemotaxis family, chemotaxis protein CheY [Verrucomicrobiota bacterium]
MKLLIVDDSSVVRRAIERDLESGQITEVDQAATGEDALRLYGDKLHDVVTLDITMPGMDGLTCLDKIIEINPAARVLIISALRDKATAIDAIKRGASGFLCKPISPSELKEAFELLIED